MGAEGEKEDGGLKGKALVLASLVEYQAGAVVSREIMRSKAGTVSVFAFDAGAGLSEHTAPFDALVQVLEGAVEIVIGGESVVAERGESVIMPPGVPHLLRAPQRFKMLLTLARGE